MDRLIDHGATAAPTAKRRRRLHEAAHGNPLALRELLYGAKPGGLTDMITARLRRLDPRTRHAVELVAWGEPLSLSELDRLVGLPVVAAAEDSGMLRVERVGARRRVRLDHPLYGEVLRGTMRLSRR